MTFKLQQKLIAGVVIVVCLFGLIGYTAHRDLDEIDTKVKHVETAHDLTNTILEMRRSEKNYFLYDDRESLNQVIDYIERLEKSSHNFGTESKSVMGEAGFQSFINSLQAYKDGIAAIIGGGESVSEDTMEKTRYAGRQLYKFMKELSEKERINIAIL